MFGKTVSDLQENIKVENGAISGTLKFIEGGVPEAGFNDDGYYLALKWSNIDADATSLKVGLKPSAIGMDLVECINDPDHNGLFMVTPELNQRFVVVQSNANGNTKQYFALDGLVFDDGMGA